ncbi:hypothetical protein [Sphingobacterium spiritivorum]|uniref:hypothetical protein n=1 Tax=Sphingobacterium spiritivorum TaxID=258 RepID=UPI003DA61C45
MRDKGGVIFRQPGDVRVVSGQLQIPGELPEYAYPAVPIGVGFLGQSRTLGVEQFFGYPDSGLFTDDRQVVEPA